MRVNDLFKSYIKLTEKQKYDLIALIQWHSNREIFKSMACSGYKGFEKRPTFKKEKGAWDEGNR